MKFYAVRMGDFVEIRSASRCPKGLVSVLTKTVVRYHRRINYPPYELPLKRPTKSKITLKTVFYPGGKVIGTMKRGNFERWVVLGTKNVQEIPPGMMKILLPHLSR